MDAALGDLMEAERRILAGLPAERYEQLVVALRQLLLPYEPLESALGQVRAAAPRASGDQPGAADRAGGPPHRPAHALGAQASH